LLADPAACAIDSGVFLTQPIPTSTPVPAALPLFATGFGLIGLLGWRRKWKGVAEAAT
jgi:hypothetical protein